MEEIIHTFGIDGRLILTQIVNFGILMVVLTYLLYKPVLNVLEEREEKISKGLKNADDAAKQLALAEEERRGIIAAANRAAEAMEQRAVEHAQKRSEQILAEAHKKAEQVIKDATDRGHELKVQALRETEAEIAKITMLAVEKVLNDRAS